MKHETHFPIPPAAIVRSLCSASNRTSREWLATASTLPHVSAAGFWGVGSKMALTVSLVAINFPTLSSSREEITPGKAPVHEFTISQLTKGRGLELERRSQYPKTLP